MPPQAAPAAAAAAAADAPATDKFSLLRTIAIGFIGMQAIGYLTGRELPCRFCRLSVFGVADVSHSLARHSTTLATFSISTANSPILTKTPVTPGPAVVSNNPTGAGGLTPTTPLAPVKQVPVVPYWLDGQLLDVHAQLSTSKHGNSTFTDSSLPSVTWEGLLFSPKANWHHSWSTEWTVPPSVQHNATLWLDAFVTPAGRSPNPAAPTYPGKRDVLHVRKPLTRYHPLRKVRATKNLLAGPKLTAEERAAEDAAEEAEFKALPIVSYYHPNVSLQVVTNGGAFAYHSFPPALQELVHLVDTEDKDDKGRG